MSGLSKHLPALDDSRESSFQESFFDRAERNSSRDNSDDTRRTAIPKPSSSPPLHGSGLSSRRRTPEPHDTTLDLSTSKITEEVIHALKGKKTPVVVGLPASLLKMMRMVHPRARRNLGTVQGNLQVKIQMEAFIWRLLIQI